MKVGHAVRVNGRRVGPLHENARRHATAVLNIATKAVSVPFQMNVLHRSGSFDHGALSGRELSKAEIEARGRMTSRAFREMVRRREWEPDASLTQHYCAGYAQHSVVIVPRDYALEFLVFCLRNPRACYVADVCEAGSPHPAIIAPDADLRTDCHRYRVFRDGVLVDEPSDILSYWSGDLVAFLLNCSMGFEGVLRQRNVNFVTNGTHVSNIPCLPSGRFRCEGMIVSTRIFPTSNDAVRAIQITSALPISHGYPLDIGDGANIGINLAHPMWNPSYPEPPVLPKEGSVCMSWGCAVTPEIAIQAAKPPIAIVHYPGMVFIGDARTEEYHSSFLS
jgi:uncharacterized protein YcsI (UPF0317 family)